MANDEVGYGTMCHDSMGNLVNGLGNPIKEAEVIEEEEGQERDEELKLRQEQEVAFRPYSTDGTYQEPKIYLTLC